MQKLLVDQASMMKAIKPTNEMLVSELKEVNTELSSQTKVIDDLKDSLSYFSSDVEDLKNENQIMNKEMIKEGNLFLAEKVGKVQKNERTLSIRVIQIENFLKANYIEIQGVAVSENENQEDFENINMDILKIVEPQIVRQQIRDIKCFRPTRQPQDKR